MYSLFCFSGALGADTLRLLLALLTFRSRLLRGGSDDVLRGGGGAEVDGVDW